MPEDHRALIKQQLEKLTITRVKKLYRLLFPGGDPGKNRVELNAVVLKFLCFESQKSFDDWFGTLNDLERTLIQKLAFHKVFPVTLLEQETGTSILTAEKRYYETVVRLNSELKLFFLDFYITHGVFVVAIPEVLQTAFKPFLKQPEYRDINGDINGRETVVFNIEKNFARVFTLLYESLPGRGKSQRIDSFQTSLKIPKRESEALYRESGFPHFPVCGFSVPDSLSLAAAFISCQHHGKLSQDTGDIIREMVGRFFFSRPGGVLRYYYYAGSYFEGLLVGAYLKKRASPGFDTAQEHPAFRQVFFDFLKSLEHRDAAVSMNEAFSFILERGIFSFSQTDLTRLFRLKASSVTVDGVTYTTDENEIVPEHALFFELITKPAFRAYCFVFGALGCLELTVAEPVCSAVSNDKNVPLSPYDGLCAVRLTEFGKWCLGFTETQPEENPQDFEITADPSFLYVTLRGESLERRVFLDTIGIKIGGERWTVNAASFVGGCKEKAQVTERIKKFRTLIDNHPAKHWEALFAHIEKNAGAVDERTDEFRVYQINTDKETRASLVNDATFRRMARLAEENLILVRESDRLKFLSFLANRGIGALATSHSLDGFTH
jgi:hypothetical protein